MPITYKVNILQSLKDKGFSSYRLRQEKLLGQATIQKLRDNEPVSWENIATVCKLLHCQPGDIIEFVEE